MSRLTAGTVVLALLLAPACKRGAKPSAPVVDVAATMQAVVADFRGVIVLLADEPAADDKATVVARLLFQENEERLGTRRDPAA